MLDTPFIIGEVEVPNRVVLGPMAGLTNSAYRSHMRGHGAGLLNTEMVSAHGLIYGNKRTLEYITFRESEERPLAVQLFDDSPEIMARATEIVLEHQPRADIIDINMGCPVKKVIRTGAGSALLADLDRAAAVAAATVRVCSPLGVPVTVKIRTGVKMEDRVAPELAKRLEAVGVQGLCVHPRAAVQFYQGVADHSVTAEVVASVGIPVIASGDINSLAAAQAVLAHTGAAAVMVARGAAGNPWLIDSLISGEPLSRPPLEVVVADLQSLLVRTAEDLGSQRAARWARKLIGWYLRPSRVPVPEIERLRALPDVETMSEALEALTAPLMSRT